jgi:hypothetical protein
VKPRAVLVETNWVVDLIAPAHLQNPQAAQLLSSAKSGEIELHVPAICLTEARETVPRRFIPRSRSGDLRKFLAWAKSQDRVTDDDAAAAYRVFDKFEGLVTNELTKVPERLKELAKLSYLNVFPLSEAMLERQVEIGALGLSLMPYDLAVLAAVVIKAEELQKNGHAWVSFCELDSDLQPWDKSGARKVILSDLYNHSRIRVYGDFILEDIDEISDDW